MRNSHPSLQKTPYKVRLFVVWSSQSSQILPHRSPARFLEGMRIGPVPERLPGAPRGQGAPPSFQDVPSHGVALPALLLHLLIDGPPGSRREAETDGSGAAFCDKQRVNCWKCRTCLGALVIGSMDGLYWAAWLMNRGHTPVVLPKRHH